MALRFEKKYSATGFRVQLKKAWEDNASCIYYVVQYTLKEDEMAPQIQDRLIANQQEIGQLIGHFYGIKQSLADMFVDFIKMTFEAIRVLKFKTDMKSFRRIWYEKTDSLVKILDTLEKWDMRPLFYEQIRLTEALIMSYIKYNDQEQAYYYAQLAVVGRNMSVIVSEKIINSHSNNFGI